MPVRSSLFHPSSNNNALIATEIGIWGTSNLLSDNTQWYPYNENFANVRVDMLNIRDEDNLVLASTHGRGQFYGIYNIDSLELGDLNSDYSINILDVVILVNNIINSDPYIL